MNLLSSPGKLVLVVATVLATTVATAGSRKTRAPSFSADPSASETLLEQETWVVSTPHYLAKLRQVDDETRRAFIRERTGLGTDPFATPPGRSAPFLSFLLELENPTPGQLVFQPQRCRLLTRDRAPNYPLDLPTLEAAYGVLGREMPPAYRHVRAALFDGEVVLAPGERASGLLVFRMLPPKTKWFRVDVALTNGMGDALGFQAPYRRNRR